ncbi:MAG: hypothetical protein ACLSHC_16205 [Bilophila wadsworthia]
MLQKTEFIWFDGKLVPWDQANPCVPTVHYGTGVFAAFALRLPDGSSAVFRLPGLSASSIPPNPWHQHALYRRRNFQAIVRAVVANKLSENHIPCLCRRSDERVHGNNRIIIAVWPEAPTSGRSPRRHPHQDQLLRPYAS